VKLDLSVSDNGMAFSCHADRRVDVWTGFVVVPRPAIHSATGVPRPAIHSATGDYDLMDVIAAWTPKLQERHFSVLLVGRAYRQIDFHRFTDPCP
jgi:hypothetical protein